MGVVKDGRADRLARCLANMPGKRAAAFIVIKSLGQRPTYLEKALDTELALEAYRRAVNRTQRAYEKSLELPGGTETQSSFQEGCSDNRLISQTSSASQDHTFLPGQEAEGLRLPSAGARRTPASIGSRVETLPEALADLIGPLGDRVRRGRPESSISAQLVGSLRETFEIHGGGTKEAIAGASSLNLGWNGVSAQKETPSQDSQKLTCWRHTTVTSDSRKPQDGLGKLVNRSRHAAHADSLGQQYQRRHPHRCRPTD